MQTPMTPPCEFCGQTEVLEQAIDAGWIPCFWDEANNAEVLGPVCVACQAIHGVVYDDDFGDYKLPEAGTPAVVVV